MTTQVSQCGNVKTCAHGSNIANLHAIFIRRRLKIDSRKLMLFFKTFKPANVFIFLICLILATLQFLIIKYMSLFDYFAEKNLLLCTIEYAGIDPGIV